MKAWSELYDMVLPHVPGCHLPMADLAIREAYRQLVNDAWLIRIRLDPIYLNNSVTTYDIDFPDNMVLYRALLAVMGNGDHAYYTSEPYLRFGNRYRCGNYQVYLPAPNQVQIDPKPDTGLTLEIEGIFHVTHSVMGMDDLLVSQHAAAIAKGALSQLMMSPKKPYSDMQLGAVYQNEFLDMIEHAKSNAQKAYSRSPQRTVSCF